ncbi:glutamate ligase domain-containing protein [Longimicrobium sp.]|uniref:glutamate ligase domain-containing protein n=1 Tax=Longimicrobium sp. TaxID=2029185 RepID=UPI002E2F36F6|nr:cyanophycin synthetase [Longimicrobium sp.]HEX6038428.1 cyanophycin synthetase [Longimicrobium sp.]
MENVLAAIAAAHAQGMPVDMIRDGLMTFLPSGAATPGRMNVLRTARGTLIVDYAHNPAALRGLMDVALRMEARRRIGLVAMPGDRRDDDLRELGQIASVLDYVIAKEHGHYRRGRAPGESAALIAEGLRAGGMGEDRYELVPEEPDAVARALEMMRPGDLVVVLADDLPAVMAQLRPLVDAEG